MSFLLDTMICSAYLKGSPVVFPRFLQHGGRLAVSTITVGELSVWAHRSRASADRLRSLQGMLRDVTVFDVTVDVAMTFGTVRAELLDRGRPVPQLDLFIAATALVHDLVLVTHNVKDFAGIPDLTVIDWLEP